MKTLSQADGLFIAKYRSLSHEMSSLSPLVRELHEATDSLEHQSFMFYTALQDGARADRIALDTAKARFESARKTLEEVLCSSR